MQFIVSDRTTLRVCEINCTICFGGGVSRRVKMLFNVYKTLSISHMHSHYICHTLENRWQWRRRRENRMVSAIKA